MMDHISLLIYQGQSKDMAKERERESKKHMCEAQPHVVFNSPF